MTFLTLIFFIYQVESVSHYFSESFDITNAENVQADANSVPISGIKSKDSTYETIAPQQAVGNYSNLSFINMAKVPPNEITYQTSGDQLNHPFSYALDGNMRTYWAASNSNNESFKNVVILEFSEIKCIEAIIYGPAYSTMGHPTHTRRYDGYPTHLNIYASLYDYDYQLKVAVIGAPKDTDIWDSVAFVFSRPISCTKLKLEFVEVTYNNFFGQGYYPSCYAIYFIQHQGNLCERIDLVNEAELSANIQIASSSFSQIGYVNYGGAIYLIHYSLSLQTTLFSQCSANIAGGAIYVNTKKENQEHQVSILSSTFEECNSKYGGSICIISGSSLDTSQVNQCSFHNNTALNSGSYGSCVLFLGHHVGSKGCTFEGGNGSGSVLRRPLPDSFTAADIDENDDSFDFQTVFG